MEPVGEYYAKEKAVAAIEKGEVAIISGGTGNPYFTTDTASALRAVEIEAEIMFKGTRVDGVYTADPEKDPDAKKFEKISFDEIYNRNLRIMDLTATTFAWKTTCLFWFLIWMKKVT
jgi:uridylate kinase